MSSLQEIQATMSSESLDPQQYQQYQPTDVAQHYTPMHPPSHPDVSLTTNVSDMQGQMASLYQANIEGGNTVNIPMPMSMSNLPPPSVPLAMDVTSVSQSAEASSSDVMSDFSLPSSSFAVDTRLSGLETLDSSNQVLSSPSATSNSTNPSHASSPGMNGVASSYSAGSSSLASALEGMGMARSRSGSSASPPNLTSANSEFGFSTSGSGPPTAAHDQAFQFPPTTFESPQSAGGGRESSPDLPGGAHLMVLGDMLKNIAHTANSGSQACSNGQSTDARDIVGLLKKNVLLVAELVAAMQLGDPSNMLSAGSSPARPSAVSVNAPNVPGLDVSQQSHINGFEGAGSLDPDEILDMSDISRKRCASSVAGDRVQKAMKLEPQDDELASLQIPQPTAMHPPTTILDSSMYSFSPQMQLPVAAARVADLPPMNPPLNAALPSRPPSPSSISTHHQMSVISDPQHPQSQSMQNAMHYPPLLDLSHPLPSAVVDFSAPPPAVSAPPSTISAPGFNAAMSNAIWTEGHAQPPLHRHSLSAGSGLNGLGTSVVAMSGSAPAPFPSTTSFSAPHAGLQQHPSALPVVNSNSSANPPVPPAVRTSRSSSFSTSHVNIMHAYPEMPPGPSGLQYSLSRDSSPEYEDDGDFGFDSDEDDSGYSPPQYSSPHSGSNWDEAENKPIIDRQAGNLIHQNSEASLKKPGQRRMSRTSPTADGGNSSHGNEIPQEYRAEVERVFFEFLNSICSNLDATDAKGEPIHQTLMAKKMQRLDESPDFRPFKFRIQAFTNAYLEELARQGYPEEKIPMKKIRNFLWNQPFISRFNEEGKKSKSKGNHIWHVDAKKCEGGWQFRPFNRKLAGAPPGVAYVGLRWTWTPRIWDPQASRTNLSVQYSSPSLPSWLSWNDDVLSGIPTPDAQNCDVTVEAKFVQDGNEELLTHTVHVTIAPMANVDSSFTPSRRPSLVGDIQNLRRILSDPTAVRHAAQPSLLRAQTSLAPIASVVAPDSQVVQVLTTAAQRVAQEAQSQVIASPSEAGPELQALAKQQHVLTVTAQAVNSKILGESSDNHNPDTQSSLLTAAAQQVVLQAVRQVAADRSAVATSTGVISSQATSSQVTVKEVSVATQTAVAQAVDMVGPLSSEVDVLMTATSLLQRSIRATQAPGALLHDSQLSAPLDPTRSYPPGSSPPGSYSAPAPAATSAGAVMFPLS